MGKRSENLSKLAKIQLFFGGGYYTHLHFKNLEIFTYIINRNAQIICFAFRLTSHDVHKGPQVALKQ